MSRYADVYKAWMDNPEDFWMEAAQGIDWVRAPEKAFNPDDGVYGRWFDGGLCNTSYNCLDRHVEAGMGDVAALIYDSPITGSKRVYSYAELTDEVATFAAVLQDKGVGKGDRVIIYMPMVPEAAIAMLACARIGAIHSVVFGGFAPHELVTRIDDAKPKVIVSASCGIEPNRVIAYKPLLDKAVADSKHKPDHCIILEREEHAIESMSTRDHDWTALMDEARAAGRKADPEPMNATDPLYILYTSGTTGQPKGVVRDTGGHMVALKWSMDNIYDVKTGETYWAASDVAGWSATPISSMRRFCRAARPFCLKASRSERRMPAHSGGSSKSIKWLRCSPRQPHFVPSRKKTRRRNSSQNMTRLLCGRCSWPVSGPILTRSNGLSRSLMCRCWTIGGRPRRAGRLPAIRSGWNSCR